MRDVIVGTLSKKPDLCDEFIQSLTRCHPYFDKGNIIVIDDSRLPKEDLAKMYGGLDVIRIPSMRPWGFSKNANFLIQAALIKQVDLFMCNDDTTFLTPNSIYAMQQVSSYYPNVGVLSPTFIGLAGNPKQMAVKGLYKEGEVLYIEKERSISFVAVYFPLPTLEKVGYLNEIYNEETYGWEDDEYCDRVMEAGLDLGITPLVKMRHGKAGDPFEKSFSNTYRDLVNFELMKMKGTELYKKEKERKKLLNATQFGRM